MISKIVRKLGNSTCCIIFDKEDRELYGLETGCIVDIEIKGVKKNGTED